MSLRVTALWSRLADYSASFFEQLSRHAELQIVFTASGGDLAFDEFDVSYARDAIRVPGEPPSDLEARVRAFAPDVVMMSGWNFQHYRRLARRLRRDGIRVVASLDNPWRGDLRQRLGILAAPWYLKPAIDTFFVAGERQAHFAQRLGYLHAFEGVYCANVDRFADMGPLATRPSAFLFVGRLIARKGVPQLLEAYRQYRSAVSDPMPLIMAGRGSLEPLCRAAEGVELRGFVQPRELPALFARAQCLLLPSLVEHWGVVLHEAAAAGLALIASRECGAVVNFLRDGANGFRIDPKPDSILQALLDFHALAPERREALSHVSRGLARAWTPEIQVQQFLRHVARLRAERSAP